MKNLIPALITVLSAVGLALSACAPPEDQSVEATATGIRATATTEATREAVRETTEEATEVPETPTIEGTEQVVGQATRQTEVEPVTIVLWTAEVETNGGLQFVRSLTEEYVALNPNVAFDLISKDVESLREDFLTAGAAGKTPDLLWTVNAHIHPFVDAELLMPVDDRFDADKYVESASAAVQVDGQMWGIPINSGGHLMLIYNRDLIEQPPRTTEELVAMGMALTTDDQYGLVYNQTAPQWLVPWLGGFGGSVFAEDGTTPTLNTQEMVNTLQFLYDIKTATPIVPEDSDYEGAHILFTRGEAAMIINGDWSLSSYKQAFGDKLGIARIPRVSPTGEWPHPYTSGTYLMFPINTASDQVKLEAVTDFAEFVTNAENQELLVTELNRLPTLKKALEAPAILNDPILKGSADQMIVSRPEPTVSEMRCNWEAMTPEMQAVLSGDKPPEEAAVDMQQAAEICVERLEER
jgi:arabinogalactan oligomer/maltooligosaccharide transport system substrate-binding protein